MLNYQLQIVGDEFVTSIGHDYEFYVNLFFDRSIYRPMCTHMGKSGGLGRGRALGKSDKNECFLKHFPAI